MHHSQYVCYIFNILNLPFRVIFILGNRKFLEKTTHVNREAVEGQESDASPRTLKYCHDGGATFLPSTLLVVFFVSSLTYPELPDNKLE
jgi:hypothetical protein